MISTRFDQEVCIPYPEAVSQMARYGVWFQDSEIEYNQSLGLLWYLQHQPCVTRGTLTGVDEVYTPAHVPVYQTERGGKATYHGPGQLVVYPIVNIRSVGT